MPRNYWGFIGILPYHDIQSLIEEKCIISPTEDIKDNQIQPASLDLRLGDRCWVVNTSILPAKDQTVKSMLDDKKLVNKVIDLTKDGTILTKGNTYIVEIKERLDLPEYISGKANPKSSVGRIGLFGRVLTDYGQKFDEIPTQYSGQLFVELSVKSFSVKINTNDRLVQLRLEGSINNKTGHRLVNVQLTPTPEDPIVGYKAKSNTNSVLDYSKVGHYDPNDFWEAFTLNTEDNKVILYPDEFYILASDSQIEVGAYEAAEMVPFDERIGEFRAHYAGFFDPGFCAKGVLEVKTGDASLCLRHGQPVANIIYYSLVCKPDRIYGDQQYGSHYQSQGLQLSKHFKTKKMQNITLVKFPNLC